jgi:uncharacterized SAM-binding protein YcdF (DUF218 family)
MFILLSKLLPLFIYPLGLAFILLLLGLFLPRRFNSQRLFVILAILLIWIGSNRWVAFTLARSLEWRYLPGNQIAYAEAIVVLGGGTDPLQQPRSTVEINGAGDRVLYAAKLYHQGKADHILLSGGRIDWLNSGTSPAEEMASILELLGVPRDAMWLETTSRNTYENAVNSQKIMAQQDVNRIILVTSALHMPRALGLFRHQGLEVIPAPTDFQVTFDNWQQLTEASFTSQIMSLFPSVDNLSSVTQSLKEYIGLFVYHLRGWL